MQFGVALPAPPFVQHWQQWLFLLFLLSKCSWSFYLILNKFK
jgi:hypothetical protein